MIKSNGPRNCMALQISKRPFGMRAQHWPLPEQSWISTALVLAIEIDVAASGIVLKMQLALSTLQLDCMYENCEIPANYKNLRFYVQRKQRRASV
jgi:hypothetical protein